MMEMPASTSELSSSRTRRNIRPAISGIPPATRAASSGTTDHLIPNTVPSIANANRSTRCSTIASSAIAAMTTSRDNSHLDGLVGFSGLDP